MTTNIEFNRTANILIREHGDKAAIHAAMRADELLEAGDRVRRGLFAGWVTR